MNANLTNADASSAFDLDHRAAAARPAASDVCVSAAVAALMLSALYQGPRRSPIQERISRTSEQETARRIRRRTEKASRARNRKRR